MRKKLLDHDYFFILPALCLFLFIIVIPFIRGIGLALTNWDGFSPTAQFTGLRNFFILFRDEALLNPLKNTVLFTFLTVVFVNIVGLCLALIVNNKFFGVGLLKTIYFMPIVISLVLASFIWSYIFSDVFTKIFSVNGLLGNSKTVIFGLSIICLWRDAGLAMLTYLASLKSVPLELYEAAKVDGTNAIERFFHIIIPMIWPAITINVTLWLGWGLKVFDYPMAATNGGPGRSSWTLAIYVYQYTFPYGKAGYGQAAALILFILVATVTLGTAKLLRSREQEL